MPPSGSKSRTITFILMSPNITVLTNFDAAQQLFYVQFIVIATPVSLMRGHGAKKVEARVRKEFSPLSAQFQFRRPSARPVCGKSVKCPAGDIVVLGCVGATSLLLSLPPQAKIGKQKISLEAKGPVMATTLCCIQSLARFCQPLRKIRNFVFPSMRFEFEWRAHLQLASCRTTRIARCKSRFAVCERRPHQSSWGLGNARYAGRHEF